MSDPLPSWPRPHHVAGGGQPFVFYVIFGSRAEGMQLSRRKYRCDGIPEALDLMAYGPESQPDVVDSFREGYLWDELQADDSALARRIAAQDRCIVLRGALDDLPTLDDFRNTIGLATCLLDNGGVGIFDPQSFQWWSAHAWKTQVFDPAQPLPHRHVLILTSPEPDGTHWLHTRGMRKFGRPDLSVRGVPATHRAAAKALIDRFIEFQALGGVIGEGQAIRMAALPDGMVCSHGGNEDDPDFNNAHVEIRWPRSAIVKP